MVAAPITHSAACPPHLHADFLIEAMREEDIPRILEIDRASYPSPWGPEIYLSELQNPACSLIVARGTEDGGRVEKWESGRMGEGDCGGDSHSPIPPFLHSLNGPTTQRPNDPRRIVGYVATWLSGEELHVTAIAVDPARRRHRVGLRLMLHALKEGRGKGARCATLEVRQSNLGARRLYERLGFVTTGLRPGYYQDTGEDAVIMSLHDLTAPETYVRWRQIEATGGGSRKSEEPTTKSRSHKGTRR